jgi:hypothetical protein
MKFFIVFVACLFCFSIEASAVHRIEQQAILSTHSAVYPSNTSVAKTQKLSYKKRVALKFQQFKAKTKNTKAWALGLLIGGVVLGIIGYLLVTPFNTLTSGMNGNVSVPEAGRIAIAYLFGIIFFILSGVLLIAALIVALV